MELLPAAPRLPHVYEMASRVYTRMMASGQHQAVVISGESGAGKTETAKLLLQFFAHAASAGSPESDQGTLRTRVMGTNPIMESLGCAQVRAEAPAWRGGANCPSCEQCQRGCQPSSRPPLADGAGGG
eukprot:3513226-Prymnesium_polylepis.1